MSRDLFISYAWTSATHREWVRLLAANFRAAGYNVLVDVDVDYGNGLTGFMRTAIDCRHVLMIVDENYVYRADHLPGSGVGIENKWISGVHEKKAATWLSVLFKGNPEHRLPAWLAPQNPKGHLFNAEAATGSFPGSEQVEELWRWMEDLPANRDHAHTVATLRARAKRLESIDREREPNAWSNPSPEGEVHFEYERSPGKSYSLGYGEYRFHLHVSACDEQTVYVLKDLIHAVGLNRTGSTNHVELAAQLTPGRYVIAGLGQQVILQNHLGAFCIVDIVDAQRGTTAPKYSPASVRFRYRILLDS